MNNTELPNPGWVVPDDDPDRSALYIVRGYTAVTILRASVGRYMVWFLGKPAGTAPTMSEARELGISTLRRELIAISDKLAFLLSPNKELPNVDR